MWRRTDGGKREWSRCREKGVSEGDTNSPLGKGWTGVAAPILTLSENWGPHGDKEGGATLPRLLCVSKRGNGACSIIKLDLFSSLRKSYFILKNISQE